MEHRKYPEKRYKEHLLAMPFILMMIFPLMIFDVFLTIYHHMTFPLYGMLKLDRKRYIQIDRHKLKYLGIRGKLFCMYCGYANGLIQYAQDIAAETERYWCGIKHKQNEGFKAPKHHEEFLEYGDIKAFHDLVGDRHTIHENSVITEEKAK